MSHRQSNQQKSQAFRLLMAAALATNIAYSTPSLAAGLCDISLADSFFDDIGYDIPKLPSLQLATLKNKNPLILSAIQTLLKTQFDPSIQSSGINDLSQIHALIDRYFEGNSDMDDLYHLLKASYSKKPMTLTERLAKIKKLRIEDLNKAYQELARLQLSIELYMNFPKEASNGSSYGDILQIRKNLAEIKNEFAKVAHYHSDNIGLVQAFVQEQSPLVRELLAQRYDFKEVGANEATMRIARDLKLGELEDLKLLPHFLPYAEMLFHGKDLSVDENSASLLLYDSSGSMSGRLLDYQTALNKTIISRIVGKQRGQLVHKALLASYDDKVSDAIIIRNHKDALNIIKDHRAQSTQSGTNIERVLLEALTFAVNANKQAGKPLKKLSIAVIGDGGSGDVDFQKFLKFREQLQNTQIEILFISLGAHNPSFEDLSHPHIDGLWTGRYVNIPNSVLNAFDADSTFNNLYYTENQTLPYKVDQLLERSLDLAKAFEQKSKDAAALVTQELRSYVEKFNSEAGRSVRGSELGTERPLEVHIIKLRQFLYGYLDGIVSSQEIKERIMVDIMRNFSSLTGIHLQGLTSQESGHLERALQEALEVKRKP